MLVFMQYSRKRGYFTQCLMLIGLAMIAMTVQARSITERTQSVDLFAIFPNQAQWGDPVTLYGAGFIGTDITKNTVFFTDKNGAALVADNTFATSNELHIIVPQGAQSGPVWVEVTDDHDTSISNEIDFILEPKFYTFVYGDNGNILDDTYSLWIDGQQVSAMSAPSSAVVVQVELAIGEHTVTLQGESSEDEYGTYKLILPQEATPDSTNPPLEGDNLIPGKSLNFKIEI